MGVPKFFRWLAERYPLVNKYINETLPPDFGEGSIRRSCLSRAGFCLYRALF
jgi:hypothetical protein